jgi:hypothetical protein
VGTTGLSATARWLRRLHSAVGVAELACLGELWFSALARRRSRALTASIAVLAAEGVALVVARGCPIGILERWAGDDVALFDLWFGPRAAPYAIPAFSVLGLGGAALVMLRPPVQNRDPHVHRGGAHGTVRPAIHAVADAHR